MALGLRKKITNYQFYALFFALLTDIHLIFSTLLCNTEIQIKFEFGFDPLIFHEFMALGLRKKSRIISFPDFFSLSLQINTLLCHTKIQIKFEFGSDPLVFFSTKLWPLDLEKHYKLSVFCTLQSQYLKIKF
jgi:hypothetical protein